jgi:glycosyltransferase involved in cell wall biosynthesis
VVAARKDQPAGPSPVRVLLWSPGGSGEHYHGPGSFAYRLYSKAAPGVFEITLAHWSSQQERYGLFAQQHLVSRPGRGLARSWRFQHNARRWIAQHATQFDVFHGLAAFHATVAPALCAQRMGIPAVVFLANHRIELTDKPGLKRLLGLPHRRRDMVKQLSGLIAMSQAIYEELIGYGVPPRKIARIPMGIDTDRFRPANESDRRHLRARLGWPDRPTIIFMGGITPRKQPHLLIEAVRLAKERGIDCQAVLIGPEHDQQYVRRMREQALDLGVEDRVIWFGFTADPSEPCRAGDAFCLPSQNEGMSAAVVEAMASGLPCVVTAVSGMADLIQDGVQGRIVQGTAAAIIDALTMYFTDAHMLTLHGNAARQRVVERFSAQAVLNAYERLFRRIMAGGDAAE